MNIHESAEDYLETILMLCEEHGSAARWTSPRTWA